MRIIAAFALLLAGCAAPPLASPQPIAVEPFHSDLFQPDPSRISCGEKHKPFGYALWAGGFANSSSMAVFCSAPATPATRPGEARIVIFLRSPSRGSAWADSDTCPILHDALTGLSKAEPLPPPKPDEEVIVITGDGTDFELFLQLPLPGAASEARTLHLIDRAGDPHPVSWQGSAGQAIVTMEKKLTPCWQAGAPG